MKHITIAGLLAAGLMLPAVAQADTAYPMKTPHYTFDKATVIAGAKIFADHCMACHSISSLRYDRLTSDLGMPKAEVEKAVMLPNGAGYKQGIVSTMPPDMAPKWFGKPPPDLSHMIRYKGQDFIYTYLLSFYRDPTRPSGWNNHVFPDVAMPWVLAPWGGIVNGKGQVLEKGSLSKAQFDQQVTDIIAFLRYASDPSVFERHAIGPWVLGLLFLFTVLAYGLKKEYWKDVKK